MADGTAALADKKSRHDELVAIARSFTETFRARAADAEANRKLHRETHEAMLDAGLYRVQMPERYGGFEMSHRTMLDISVEIGRGCGSSAWIFSNIAAQNGIVSMASRQAQDDVWSEDGSVCTASSFPAKGGKVEKVEGGLVANGVWSFASGVDWAD